MTDEEIAGLAEAVLSVTVTDRASLAVATELWTTIVQRPTGGETFDETGLFASLARHLADQIFAWREWYVVRVVEELVRPEDAGQDFAAIAAATPITEQPPVIPGVIWGQRVKADP